MSDPANGVWPRLTGIFRELFDDESLELSRETTAEDVEGWDSLTHVELLVEIERAFGIRFNTGEVAGLSNVGEMADLIARRTGAAGR